MIDPTSLEIGSELADASGKRWRVYGKCPEPTVFIEEIEPIDDKNKIRLIGGVTGQMWQRMSLVQ